MADTIRAAVHPNSILHKMRGGIPAEIAVMFNPLGTVPMQDPVSAAASLAEVRELGLAGVEIASNVGSDFPAMDREEPAGRTLRAMDLPADVLEDITWHNCFRFLGIDPPKLFSSR